MQTLTRLLGRLWEALCPRTLRPPERARGPRGASRWPDFWAPRRSLGDYQVRSVAGPKLPAAFKDSDDIAFCTWMYYLN